MKLTTESTVINDKKINTDIDTAQTTADDAKTIATDTAQYFWFASTGTDTGAHISEQTRADFEANPSGGNLLANSNGIAVRDGMTELATFGATATIGKTSAAHMALGADSIEISDAATSLLKIRSTQETVEQQNIKNTDLVLESSLSTSGVSLRADSRTGMSTSFKSAQASIGTETASGNSALVETDCTSNGGSAELSAKRKNGSSTEEYAVGVCSYAIQPIHFKVGSEYVYIRKSDCSIYATNSSAALGTSSNPWSALYAKKAYIESLSCAQITLPYTPPSDGLCLCLLRASAAGRAYVDLNNTLPTLVDGYQVAGGYINGTVFATKGQTISVASSSNMQDLAMYFVSLG